MLLYLVPGVGMGAGQAPGPVEPTPAYFRKRQSNSARYYIPYCIWVTLCSLI